MQLALAVKIQLSVTETVGCTDSVCYQEKFDHCKRGRFKNELYKRIH